MAPPRTRRVVPPARRLSSFAKRVRADSSWKNFALPKATQAQLRHLERAVKPGRDRRRLKTPVGALFVGPEGTGKTMAAAILAAALGLDLYRVDLSKVVRKYIGETEKNLSRLLTRAAERDVLLFFDEADALFGKQTEVKDSHDRYANMEVSSLLQRLEAHKGLFILATNRRGNIDDAFIRRFHSVIQFSFPEGD